MSTPRCAPACIPLFRINHAAETQGACAVFGWGHKEIFAVLVQLEGIGEIPDGSLGMVVASSAERGGARVFVHELVGPLPDVADHVHDPKRARTLGMSSHIRRAG